jgi:nicotinamidase-related amidase
LDSHRTIAIFHPIYWIDAQGKHPAPFTMITQPDTDGKNPLWRATNPAWDVRSRAYIKALADGGHPPCVIWPYHCRIGTWGHNVHPLLAEALNEWEEKYFGVVDYPTKGTSCFTEFYGIFKAEIPDPEDPATQLNTALVNKLQEADNIVVCGEAENFCVNFSVRQAASEFGDAHVRKFLFLKDCSSPVPNPPGTTIFSDMSDAFFKDMTAKGMRVINSVDF